MCSNLLESSLFPQRLDVLQFLDHYKNVPCLWLQSDADFRSREIRNEAYEYLRTTFNFQSINEVRQKIRSLRGTYNQERSRVKKSMEFGMGTQDIKVYKPKLIWYDLADSFLRLNEQENASGLCMESKRVTGIITDGEGAVTSPDELGSSTSRPQPLPSISQSHPIASLHSIRTFEAGRDNSQMKYSLPTSTTPYNPTNMKKKRENGTQNRRNVVRCNSSKDNAEFGPDSASFNEFVIFGNHVASQLQTLPLEEALKLEADIQSLITTVRVRCLTNASSIKTEHLTTDSSASEDFEGF